MKKDFVALSLSAAMLAAGAVACSGGVSITSSRAVDAYPSIFPDYNGIDLPPNIAPLNFTIRERGDAFHVVLRGVAGDSLVIDSGDPLIRFPAGPWRRLVARCAGESLTIEISVRQKHGWIRYKPLQNVVAPEPIDPYLVYRLIYPVYEWWSEMGIYQRDLESFSETPILTNSSTDHGCINCHSFNRNDPTMMTLQLRKKHSGTLVCRGDDVEKIETKTDAMPGPGVYSSWHPSGTAIAFSVNTVIQSFPSSFSWHIEVLDTQSDLVLYETRSHTMSSAPSISTPDFENVPVWSPDGKFLYFSRAERSRNPKFSVDNVSGRIVIQQPNGAWTGDSAELQGGEAEDAWVRDVKGRKYDLMRIAYDMDTHTWGAPETVLLARQTGKSMSFPRVSPDGRYLMFCMSAFGYFTIHHADSDLYVMDLATRNYRRLDEVNSDDVESFHTWSSNGRWFVFSSKRLDGVRARPFISYFDSSGKARKPFLLPQKDPDFYSTFLMTYNIPELVTGKVQFPERLLRERAIGPAKPVAFAK